MPGRNAGLSIPNALGTRSTRCTCSETLRTRVMHYLTAHSQHLRRSTDVGLHALEKAWWPLGSAYQGSSRK